jgi:hypothetical protein
LPINNSGCLLTTQVALKATTRVAWKATTRVAWKATTRVAWKATTNIRSDYLQQSDHLLRSDYSQQSDHNIWLTLSINHLNLITILSKNQITPTTTPTCFTYITIHITHITTSSALITSHLHIVNQPDHQMQYIYHLYKYIIHQTTPYMIILNTDTIKQYSNIVI